MGRERTEEQERGRKEYQGKKVLSIGRERKGKTTIGPRKRFSVGKGRERGGRPGDKEGVL